MSDMIKVPYDELASTAATIRNQAEIVRTEVTNLKNVINSLEWMGARAEKFKELWANDSQLMEQWSNTLDSFAQSLTTQATNMRNADNSF